MDGNSSFNSGQTRKLAADTWSTTQEKENSPHDVKTSELATLITQALERLDEFMVIQAIVRLWVREAGYYYRSCVSANNILTVSYAEDFMGEKRQLSIAIPISYRAHLPPDRDW